MSCFVGGRCVQILRGSLHDTKTHFEAGMSFVVDGTDMGAFSSYVWSSDFESHGRYKH
jgi:hypothetical protein